ncbi:Uncharacterised protein r2_g1303 [Pycnogonum litorale]
MKILKLLMFAFTANVIVTENAGPIFITKQKMSVEFLNTEGTKLDCLAHGDPEPELKWHRSLTGGRREPVTDIPSIRTILNNGSMVLMRFTPDRYLQDVHATTYRCTASNVHGRIISVPVSVRAITKRRKQQIQAQVYDEYVIKGNTAVLRCHIPTFFKDDLDVSAWVREDNFLINRNAKHTDRYTLTETGNLHIRNVASTQGHELGYWCKVKNRFTGETFLSQTAGRIKLTEPHGTVLPTITDILKTADVEKGKSIRLSCAAQGYPPPTYKWIKPDGTVMFETEGLLSVIDTESTGSFKYRCTVTNSNGEDSKSTLVIVRDKLGAFITQKTVHDGNGIELNCHTTGYPIQNIHWTLNGEPIVSLSIQENREKIVIRNIGRHDRGMYQCFVRNQWEVVQATLQLKLGDFAPSFVKTFEERTLQPGPSLELECSGIGQPVPVIEWIRNGNRIFRGDNVKIKETAIKDGSVRSQLNVNSIRVEDGGEYICKISNKLGVDIHSRRINVYGLPIVHKINDITVGQGHLVTINCYVSGFPIESIEWSRVDSTTYMPRTSKSVINGTLVIKDIAKKDQGRYKCTARNTGGQSDEETVDIKVLLKPQIQFASPDTLPEGGSFSLICNVVQGDGPINITWKKDDKKTKFGKGTDITSTKFYSLIQIRKLNYLHSGNYTCLAENPAGKIEKTVEVTISVAPKWKSKPKDLTVKIGGDVRIRCAGTGNPEPSTEWLKIDNSRILMIYEHDSKYAYENNKTTLVIKNINKLKDHKSKYRCVITNGVMPDLVKEITVNVVSASPTLNKLPKQSSAYNGTKWTLLCNVDDVDKDAQQQIHMLWFKDTKLLTEMHSDRIKLQRGNNNWQLVIDPLKFEDEGMYTCQFSTGNKLRKSTTKLKVLKSRITYVITTINSDTSSATDKPLRSTENPVILIKDYDEDVKQKQADSFQNSMEQMQIARIKKGTESNVEFNRESSKGAADATTINQLVIFVVPGVVVIILLIAVVSTIIAYIVVKRSAKKNSRSLHSYQRGESSSTYDNDYTRQKENVLYIPSNTNASLDRRYGRLNSSTPLRYGNNATQNTYEIPDYCGGIKPYSTLQSNRNANKNLIDGGQRDSQCSV